MTASDQLNRWRAEAEARLSVFASRYSARGVDDPSMRLAQQWHVALCRAELDPNELRAVIAEAEPYEYNGDVAFFGFINEMRSIYHQLWETSLAHGARLGDTSFDQ